MRCHIWGLGLFFVCLFCISIEHLLQINDVLSLSANHIFQSDFSFSKWLVLTDHTWVCMCIISGNAYVSVRAFTRLLWTLGSQELVSPCALCRDAGRQQLPLDSKAKEQSDPAVIGMDFGPLLFQN